MLKNINSLLFHIPHSSLFIPSDANFLETKYYELYRNINLLTDFHTDKLFSFKSVYHNNIEEIIFNYNRFYLDIERFWNDGDEVMSKVGQGAKYTHDCFGEEIRAYFNIDELNKLKTIYDDYHNNLNETTINLINKFTNCLLIDCHSFSEILKPDSSDICIGYNDDFTKLPDNTIGKIINIINDNGYSCSINDPYSGSMIPNEIYNNEENYNGKFYSLMFEINKKIYLNDDNSINYGKFNKIKTVLNQIIL